MSLRIPLGSDQTLQVEFHEIERRLRRLERASGVSPAGGPNLIFNSTSSGSGGTAINLQPILDRLTALETALSLISTTNPPDYGAVGASARNGLVPTPGLAEPPTGVAQHVLTEDNFWGFPFRGLIGVATSGEQTDLPYDVVDVSAALHVAGPFSVADLLVGTARVIGYLIPSGTLATCEDDLSIAGLI